MPSCSMVSPTLGRSSIADSVGPMAVKAPSAATPQVANPGPGLSRTSTSTTTRPTVAVAGSQIPICGRSVHNTDSWSPPSTAR